MLLALFNWFTGYYKARLKSRYLPGGLYRSAYESYLFNLNRLCIDLLCHTRSFNAYTGEKKRFP